MVSRPLPYAVAKRGLWLVLAAAAACAGCDDGAEGQFIKAASAHQFRSMVLESPRPVMVEFYKSGCPGCSLAHPNLESVSEEYADRAGFVKVPREATEVRQKYAITFYPTIFVFKGGKPVARKTGPQPRSAYARMIDDHLSTPR